MFQPTNLGSEVLFSTTRAHCLSIVQMLQTVKRQETFEIGDSEIDYLNKCLQWFVYSFSVLFGEPTVC